MVLWSLRAFSTNLLYCPTWFTQSKRTTYILKRMRPIRLSKLDAIAPKKLKRKGYYYEVVEDTDSKRKPPLEVVLTQDIPGVGMKGETVEMNIYAAYRDLLLPKLAVYADSPEAIVFKTTEKEKSYSSIYSKIVENYLSKQGIWITLSKDVKWTLEPWHVKLALRKIGVLANEDCITVPKEISGPDSDVENKDFVVYVTMNKAEKFPIRCRIILWSSEGVMVNQKTFDMNSPSEPLFPDEKELIDSLIDTEKKIKQAEKLKISTRIKTNKK